MANHYHRSPRTRSKTARYQPSSPTWLWILFGMFMGIGSSALSYMWLSNPKSAATHRSQTKLSAHHKPTKKEKEPAQKFEFYTLLPGMEVQLPETGSQTASTKAPTPPKPAVEPIQIMVQPQTSPPPPPPPPLIKTAKSKPPILPAKLPPAPAKATLQQAKPSPPQKHSGRSVHRAGGYFPKLKAG